MDLLSLKRTLQAVVICGILLLMFLVAQTAYRDFMESNIASLQKEQEKREAMLQAVFGSTYLLIVHNLLK